jgi:hypothetical protein
MMWLVAGSVAQARKRQLLKKFDDDEDNVRRVYQVCRRTHGASGLSDQ